MFFQQKLFELFFSNSLYHEWNLCEMPISNLIYKIAVNVIW